MWLTFQKLDEDNALCGIWDEYISLASEYMWYSDESIRNELVNIILANEKILLWHDWETPVSYRYGEINRDKLLIHTLYTLQLTPDIHTKKSITQILQKRDKYRKDTMKNAIDEAKSIWCSSLSIIPQNKNRTGWDEITILKGIGFVPWFTNEMIYEIT